MNLNNLYRIADYAFVSSLITFTMLLVSAFVVPIRKYFESHNHLYLLLVSLTLCCGGLFYGTRFGLCIAITGELSTSAIFGLLYTRVPKIIARILGVINTFMGFLCILMGWMIFLALL
ncbi:MAG TPA: hypothetical protein VK203_03215 [Nostocaceae cyanobacterium]|nr:hypothetical protein [Nostocaceae cyanobacterium]